VTWSIVEWLSTILIGAVAVLIGGMDFFYIFHMSFLDSCLVFIALLLAITLLSVVIERLLGIAELP